MTSFTPRAPRAIPLCFVLLPLALSLSSSWQPRSARAASLDLPGGCTSVQAAAIRAGHGGSLDASKLEVSVPAIPGAVMHAARLHVAGSGSGLSPEALGQASTAAAAALLAAVSGHREASCSTGVLRAAAQPLADAVARGGQAEVTWTGVSIRAGSKRLGARSLSLHLSGDGRTAHLVTALNGAISNDQAAALLPDMFDARISLPASRLSELLSGDHAGEPVPVTIEHASTSRGATRIEGDGHASVATTARDSSGDGHIVAHNFQDVLDAASAAGLTRLRTGLFLARLVAHRSGDQFEWDIGWKDGIMTVNGVPLPMP